MHKSPNQSSCCSTHHHQPQSSNSLLVLTACACVLSIPFALHMVGFKLSLPLQITLATLIQFGPGFLFYLGAWQF